MIMQLLLKCEDMEIYCNNIDLQILRPGSTIKSETASKHRPQFNFSNKLAGKKDVITKQFI